VPSIVTGRICPDCSSVGIAFTHGPILGFFAPQGRHVAPIKVKFGREVRSSLPKLFHLDRYRGGGVRPQKLKNWNFTNIIAPKGRSLHNFYKIYRVYARLQST